MGCLPTFGQIGYWAPALLVVLRFIQGFAVGGEWGGAVLMVAEHSPDEIADSGRAGLSRGAGGQHARDGGVADADRDADVAAFL